MLGQIADGLALFRLVNHDGVADSRRKGVRIEKSSLGGYPSPTAACKLNRNSLKGLAPQVGLESTTLRLTAYPIASFLFVSLGLSGFTTPAICLHLCPFGATIGATSPVLVSFKWKK